MERNVELIAIVTALALLQTFVFAFQVGQARVKHAVSAPATSGNEEFDRAFRIHQNTIEQMVIFVPSLWMFGYYVDARIGAGVGLVFVIARFIYRSAYRGDPQNRGTGFSIGALSMMILLIGGLIGAVVSLL
jgi:glutathione S-transferase